MSIFDASGAQTGDITAGDMAAGNISKGNTTTIGADPSRLIDVVQELAVNSQQFRNLTAASLERFDAALRELAGDVSKGDATVLSMADARIAMHRAAVAEQIAAVRGEIEPRLMSLESGVLAAILRRMDTDALERRERQAVVDTVQRATLYAIAALFIAVVLLAVLIFLGRVL